MHQMYEELSPKKNNLYLFMDGNEPSSTGPNNTSPAPRLTYWDQSLRFYEFTAYFFYKPDFEVTELQRERAIQEGLEDNNLFVNIKNNFPTVLEDSTLQNIAYQKELLKSNRIPLTREHIPNDVSIEEANNCIERGIQHRNIGYDNVLKSRIRYLVANHALNREMVLESQHLLHESHTYRAEAVDFFRSSNFLLTKMDSKNNNANFTLLNKLWEND